MFTCVGFPRIRYHNTSLSLNFFFSLTKSRQRFFGTFYRKTYSFQIDKKLTKSNKTENRKKHIITHLAELIVVVVGVFFLHISEGQTRSLASNKPKRVEMKKKTTNWICINKWFFPFAVHKIISTLFIFCFFVIVVVHGELSFCDFRLTNETGSDSCKFFYTFFYMLIF